MNNNKYDEAISWSYSISAQNEIIKKFLCFGKGKLANKKTKVLGCISVTPKMNL